MRFGRGAADFWHDVPDAVAQLVQTRLWMQLGEWWLDVLDGTPWRTEILGRHTDATRDPALRLRILQTFGVVQIYQYWSDLNRDTRNFSVQAGLDTIYGRVQTLVEPI